MTEVAARAGVSVTTVSHVLSGRRPVADATRTRVLQVIEALGDLVRSDDEGGMAQAVRYLLEQGRRRVAYVGGVPHTGPSDLREAGFRRALAEADRTVDEDLVVRGDFTREAGRAAAEILLGR